jgi:hypothetical protein
MENFIRVKEEWKEFEVVEPRRNIKYMVSNYGNVKSYNDSVENAKQIKGTIKHGYRVMTLKRIIDNKPSYYNYRFSRLVAANFVQKESEDQTHILHLDYDLLNVHFSNLKWANDQELNAYRSKNPKLIKAKQRRANAHIVTNNSKLSETQVIRLKRKILDPNRKTRLRLIAKEFNISETHLGDIKSGKRWGHIKVDIPVKKDKT